MSRAAWFNARKPRIRLSSNKRRTNRWLCVGLGTFAYGSTPYLSWLHWSRKYRSRA
jgi:hypothetical protein